MEIKSKALKISGYEICPLPTGIFGLDGGAMFGTVPKILWDRAIPSDVQNRIPMEARALLLKGEKYNVLIDCGNGSDFVKKYGEKLGSKFAEMYNIDPDGPSLLKSLKQYQISAEQITHVILTHLHFDHCGGGVSEKGGTLVPSFPNAKYFVQKSNLETAKNPNIRERSSYFASNFEPLIKADVLTVLDGTGEILPGISVEISNGHTQGQQIVKVSGPEACLVYCADLIPTSHHVRLAWIMGYDLDPLKIIEEKRALLERAASENWVLFFEHDPLCSAATVVKNGNDFAVNERFHLALK